MITGIKNSHTANASDVLARLGLKSVALAQVLIHSSLGPAQRLQAALVRSVQAAAFLVNIESAGYFVF